MTTRVLAIPDVEAIREETLEDRVHMVVPVVALVEGVIQSANSTQPELATAKEFGKFPEGWNGRPVTMGHPKVSNQFVSANSPSVLQTWMIGQLFNTKVENRKLKTEAWIDLERANSLNDESKNLVERLQAGEMVEISTGLFTEVIKIHGVFEGEEFEGIWSDVVPDHLAMLGVGSLGACSIEDGCGAPRLNINESEARQFRMIPPASQISSQQTCGCENPEQCECSEDPMPKTQTGTESGPEPKPQERTPNWEERYNALRTLILEVDEGFKANDFPADMPVDNVRRLLGDALNSREDIDLFGIAAFTREQVVFEIWDDMKFRSMDFNLTDEGKVEFTSDPIEVNLLTKISPRVNADDGGESMAETDKKGKAAPPSDAPGAGGAPVVANTLEELLVHASPELQAKLAQGQQILQVHVDESVSKILANENNTFTEDELRAFPVSTLDKLTALAKQKAEEASQESPAPTTETPAPTTAQPQTQQRTADYSGRAAPAAPDPTANEIPPAPEAFPRKSRANGTAKEG